MKYRHAYGFAVTFTLLAVSALSGCGDDSPAAPAAEQAGMGGAGAPNTTTGGGGTGGGAGGAGGGSVVVDSGQVVTAVDSGTGTIDASAEGAASDAPSGMPEGSVEASSTDAGDAGVDAGVALTAAMVKATCPMYTAGTKAFPAADFCTLFQATCVNYIDYEPLTGCAAGPKLWVTAYSGWTATQMNCRSQHLCAAAAGNASSECHSAQGFGGKCM